MRWFRVEVESPQSDWMLASWLQLVLMFVMQTGDRGGPIMLSLRRVSRRKYGMLSSMGAYFYCYYRVARNVCRSLAIFCVSRELILRLGQIGFSFWELIFAIFRKYQTRHWWYFRLHWVSAIEIANNTTVCIPYVKPVTVYPFVSDRKRASCNWTDTISQYFCVANSS